MTSSRAWWRARRAWQKAVLLLLPVAVAAVVLAVVLDSRSAPSVAERPAAEVRPEEPDLSRGLVVFDGCSLVDDAGVARDAGVVDQRAAVEDNEPAAEVWLFRPDLSGRPFGD